MDNASMEDRKKHLYTHVNYDRMYVVGGDGDIVTVNCHDKQYKYQLNMCATEQPNRKHFK